MAEIDRTETNLRPSIKFFHGIRNEEVDDEHWDSSSNEF